MVFNKISLGLIVALLSGCGGRALKVYQDANLEDGMDDVDHSYLGPFECDEHTLAFYNFEGSSPLEDVCNGVDLIDINTESTIGRNNLFGQARRLTGVNSSNLSIPIVPSIRSNLDMHGICQSDITIETWFRLNPNFNPAAQYTLIGKLVGSQPDRRNGFSIEYSSDSWSCDFSGYYDTGPTRTTIGYKQNLDDGDWHHARCERSTVDNRTSISLSLDGEEKAINSDVANVCINNVSDVYIGNSQQGMLSGNPNMPADVDEVRISKVARSFQ